MRKTIVCSILLAALVAGGGVVVDLGAQAVTRKAANFKFFFTPPDPPECVSSLDSFNVAFHPLGGVNCYSQTIVSKPGESELYITVSTTGDTHEGDALLLGCFVDGVPCNAGTTGAAQPKAPGYIVLQKLPQTAAITNCDDGGGGSADCHDNSIYYTWCTEIDPAGGLHTIDIQLANQSDINTVFIEQAHFIIDATKGVGCRQGE